MVARSAPQRVAVHVTSAQPPGRPSQHPNTRHCERSQGRLPLRDKVFGIPSALARSGLTFSGTWTFVK